MRDYQWQDIIIVDDEATELVAPRIVIGTYAVGPAYAGDYGFTAGAWGVGDIDTGSLIGLYTDLRVAINFAQSLQRTYGDISAMANRALMGCCTDDDKEILKAVKDRRLHETFMDPNPKAGGLIPRAPFDPSILERLLGA